MIPRALGCYANAAPRVRIRAWARWATSPFGPVEARLPATGRILDVACGIGVFACYAALASPGRSVVGVDQELSDIVQARLAARHAGPQGGRVDFHLAPPGEVPDGPWDAVVLMDALSRLNADEAAGLVGSCAEQLALGGVLVVKAGGAPSPPDRPSPLTTWMGDARLVVTQHPIGSRTVRRHLVVGARRRSV